MAQAGKTNIVPVRLNDQCRRWIDSHVDKNDANMRNRSAVIRHCLNVCERFDLEYGGLPTKLWLVENPVATGPDRESPEKSSHSPGLRWLDTRRVV